MTRPEFQVMVDKRSGLPVTSIFLVHTNPGGLATSELLVKAPKDEVGDLAARAELLFGGLLVPDEVETVQVPDFEGVERWLLDYVKGDTARTETAASVASFLMVELADVLTARGETSLIPRIGNYM